MAEEKRIFCCYVELLVNISEKIPKLSLICNYPNSKVLNIPGVVQFMVKIAGMPKKVCRRLYIMATLVFADRNIF
jgi:hypothetical protein